MTTQEQIQALRVEWKASSPEKRPGIELRAKMLKLALEKQEDQEFETAVRKAFRPTTDFHGYELNNERF